MVTQILILLLTPILFTIGDSANTNENVLKSCVNKICLQKCCPFGQYVSFGLKCLPYEKVLQFSSISVYDNDILKTNKTFDDLFTLKPSQRFVKDTEFRKSAPLRNTSLHIPYLTETGVLRLEVLNDYNRWTDIPIGNYCIDYRINKINKPRLNVIVKGIRFWTIIPSEPKIHTDSLVVTVATSISCVFLAATFVVYCLLPEQQNICGLILMAYVASTFVGFSLNVVLRREASYSPDTCINLTMSIYFFFLAAFCWMNVMAYDIWWTFRGYAKVRPIHRRGERFKFLMYCLYAFGLPLLMTIMLYVLNTIDMTHWPSFVTPNVPKYTCFLHGAERMFYFYIPMLILISLNWLFFLMTVFNIWRLNRGTAILNTAAAGSPAAHRNQSHRFVIYLKLSVVMGLNWVFEVISFKFKNASWLIFADVYNMLIGLFIFLIFVFKKKTIRRLKKRYGGGIKVWYSSFRSRTSVTSCSQECSLPISNNPGGPTITVIIDDKSKSEDVEKK